MEQSYSAGLLKSGLWKLMGTLLHAEARYRLYLKLMWGVDRPSARPHFPYGNAVLKTADEWENAVREVRALGLPPHKDSPKNWDSLAALDSILKMTGPNARILDAGAELYSTILPWLFLYGYRNLTGINLAFRQPLGLGPISYEYGDITKTKFKENTFDAISCLSVIEHGVDLRQYFREMSRILKPGGILVTSTDYYDRAIDTKGQSAYGAPIHVFSKDEIAGVLDTAKKANLELTDPLNLGCEEKAVRWKKFALDYTFLTFTLRKKK